METTKELEKICGWKELSDTSKSYEGICVTKDGDVNCYGCSGYDTRCKHYMILGEPK